MYMDGENFQHATPRVMVVNFSSSQTFVYVTCDSPYERSFLEFEFASFKLEKINFKPTIRLYIEVLLEPPNRHGETDSATPNTSLCS